jgi:hypothetical protein
VNDSRDWSLPRAGGVRGFRRRTEFIASARRMLIFAGLLGLALAGRASGQDLDPRAYSPNPVGVTFFVAGTGDSKGAVLPDPSLPVTDVNAELQALTVGYGSTFQLFERVASWGISGQYVWADLRGNVASEARRVTRSGLADPKFRLAMTLAGLDALSPAEFARRTPRPTLGASLIVVPPLGQYRSDRLINLGANRWSVKPELGVTFPYARWLLEASAGVWLFTDNDAFFGGTTREQRPLTTFQLHASYTFRPRLWVAASATWYTGGRTVVGEVVKADWQENARLGISASFPITPRDSLQLRYSTGANTRLGADFDTTAILWQRTWLAK